MPDDRDDEYDDYGTDENSDGGQEVTIRFTATYQFAHSDCVVGPQDAQSQREKSGQATASQSESCEQVKSA
eukprot:746168-Hanusia_phi.AAC.3